MAYTIVTGGNRGLGLEVVKALHKAGKPVIFTARNQAAIDDTLAALGSPSNVRGYQVDTSSTASVAAFGQQLQKDLPGQQVDVVINNAGIFRLEWTKADFDATIATNVRGPADVVAAVLPALRDGGLVIHVSSTLGQRSFVKDAKYLEVIAKADTIDDLVESLRFWQDSPQATDSNKSYSVSKAALNRVTVLQSQDPALRRRHISVVSVCPGWCQTDMGSTAGSPPRTPAEGAASILYPVQLHAAKDVNGAYIQSDGTPFPSW